MSGRDLHQVEAQDFADIFDGNMQGQLILESLIRRFGGKIFVPGGLEGDRQTAYNAGARSVLDYILNQINTANGVKENEPQSVES